MRIMVCTLNKHPLTFLLLPVIFVHVRGQSMADNERLIEHLFNDYNSAVRPSDDHGSPVLINISICFLQIVGVDEQSQTVATSGWLNVEWVDPRLSWDPEEYANLTQLALPPTIHPWLPRFIIINTARRDIYAKEWYEWFGVKMQSNGHIGWQPGGYFNTQCTLDITYYPFDSQACMLNISNWIYDVSQVNLTYPENAMDIMWSSFTTNGEWEVRGSGITREDRLFNNYSTVFPQVVISINIRRRYLFYVTSLLIPQIILSLIAMFVFKLPPESGEKISLCTSLLLSFVVYIMVLSQSLPQTSLSVPIIQIYLLMTMSITGLTIILSIFILRAYHKHEGARPPEVLLKLCRIPRPPEWRAYDENQSSVTVANIASNDALLMRVRTLLKNGNTSQVGPDQENNNDSAITSFLKRVTEMMDEHRSERQGSVQDRITKKMWNQVATIIDNICFHFFIVLLTFGTFIVLVIAPFTQPD